MKNYLRYISLSMISASLLFTSCDEDDAPFEDPTYVGGYAYLADQTISSFDKSEDLTIDLFTDEGVTVNSVDIVMDGSSVATANLGDGSATFSSSSLGDIATDDAYSVMLETQLSNGNTAKDPFTISVESPVSIDDENPTELTLDSISSGAAVDYSTFTFSAPIDSAELFLKKNSDGTYTNSGVDVSTEGGSIELADTNYNELNLAVNDTLYYQFTVMSGNLSESDSSFIVIAEDEE